MKKSVSILNRKARFSYEILDTYTAGIVLTGTEIKSIRASKASIAESFCEFNEHGELFVINMTIQEYDYGNHFNHRPKAERKLLLHKKELRKLLLDSSCKELIRNLVFWIRLLNTSTHLFKIS